MMPLATMPICQRHEGSPHEWLSRVRARARRRRRRRRGWSGASRTTRGTRPGTPRRRVARRPRRPTSCHADAGQVPGADRVPGSGRAGPRRQAGRRCGVSSHSATRPSVQRDPGAQQARRRAGGGLRPRPSWAPATTRKNTPTVSRLAQVRRRDGGVDAGGGRGARRRRAAATGPRPVRRRRGARRPGRRGRRPGQRDGCRRRRRPRRRPAGRRRARRASSARSSAAVGATRPGEDVRQQQCGQAPQARQHHRHVQSVREHSSHRPRSTSLSPRPSSPRTLPRGRACSRVPTVGRPPRRLRVNPGEPPDRSRPPARSGHVGHPGGS